MATWVPCGSEFITGDVIRWVEPAWKPKARKTEKARKVGARLVTAQVLACDMEWATLEVRACEVQAIDGWTVKPLDGEVRRRRGPIGQGGAARMVWSDESARSLAASRFFSGEETLVARPVVASPGLWPPAQGRESGSVTGSARGGRFRRGKKNPTRRPRGG